MKKILFALLTLLLLSSTAIAAPVDYARARKVALSAFQMYDAEMAAMSNKAVETAARWDIVPVTADGIDNVYIFNVFGYNPIGSVVSRGFVVVSGDDIASPVLAYSVEDTIPTIAMRSQNPYAFSHLQRFGQEIGAARAEGMEATAVVSRQWADIETGAATERARAMIAAKGEYLNDNIPQLLGQMIWGQGNPYNRRCPGGSVTGCVATAFGMIMNYWDYPEHGFGMHAYNGLDNPAAYPDWSYGEQYADFEHTYYDWEHMEDYAYINSSDVVIDAISTLIYQIGVSLEMRYTPDASGCWSLPEYAIFDTSLHLVDKAYTIGADYRIPRHFGYKYSYAGMRDSIGNDSLWLTMLYHSLAEGKPIYYAGWAAADNEAGHSGTSGHGYIIDGYFSDATDSNYFHINWGWNGSYNGFFKLDAMRPGGSDFTKWHGAIIGLEPDTNYHGYDYTDIKPLSTANGAVVRGMQGFISVRNVENQPVAVYDLTGRVVLRRSVSPESEFNVRVSPGFYAVKVGSAPAKKVMVY